MDLKVGTFRWSVTMNLTGRWIAQVDIHILDTGSWRWSKPCDTRWGARRLARRRAAKLSKAYNRGELRL